MQIGDSNSLKAGEIVNKIYKIDTNIWEVFWDMERVIHYKAGEILNRIYKIDINI